MTDFESAVVAAAGVLGPDGLRRLATAVGHFQTGTVPDGLRSAAVPAAEGVLGAIVRGSIPSDVAVAYMRGVAAGYEHRTARVQAELVWTGPAVFDVPVRATAAVL